MQIITHKIQAMMADINTIRQFVIKYENDWRIADAVKEQLIEELTEREKAVFDLLKSEYNTQQKKEREADWWVRINKGR